MSSISNFDLIIRYTRWCRIGFCAGTKTSGVVALAFRGGNSRVGAPKSSNLKNRTVCYRARRPGSVARAF